MCHFGEYPDEWAYDTEENKETLAEQEEQEPAFLDDETADDVRIVTDGGDE